MTGQEVVLLLEELEKRFSVFVVPYSTLEYRISALEFACGEPNRKKLGFENRLRILNTIPVEVSAQVGLIFQLEKVAGIYSEFGQTMEDRITALEKVAKTKPLANETFGSRINTLITLFESMTKKELKSMNSGIIRKVDTPTLGPKDNELMPIRNHPYLLKFKKLLEEQESSIPVDMKNLLDILPHILKLQTQKASVYGRSYCRHGDLSIFLNTERKWDRIANIMEKAMKEGTETLYNEGTPTETFVDTVVDLASYSLLWLGYIKETHPEFFQKFIDSNELEIK